MRRTCSLRAMSTSAHEDFRLALVGFGEELALRAEHVAAAPEVGCRDAAERRRLVADAIAAQHRQAVGDGVAAVAEDPGVALAILLVLLVVRVPADRGRVQQQLGAGQRHQARAFGIPLVPAHQHAEAADQVSIGSKPRSPGVK